MKVGIVCYPTYGGSGVIATELGLELARKGHEVHFISYNRPVRLSGFLDNVYFHDVDAMDYPLFEYTPYDSTMVNKIVSVAEHQDLDVLHVHYAIPHATIAYLAKKILLIKGKYLPVITTLHGTDITLVGADAGFKTIVEFGINKSDGVTAVSESLAQDTSTSFDITKDIEVIHNFVDLKRFYPHPMDHFKQAIAPKGEMILSHISNFRPVKRVQDVVMLFQRLKEKIPVKLLMIGDGPERSNTQELCRKLDVQDDVRFLGKQDPIEEILSVSDLFILPSEKESFGLAALEAMACGVPVISSNAGGLAEVNIDAYTGYLSPVGDVEDMVKKSLQLLQNKEKHKEFQENCLDHVKKFSITPITEKYIAYYRSVIESVLQD